MITLEKTERWLLATILALLALAIFGPVVLQPANHHAFADQRFLALLPLLPYAADVLSNAPFAVWGFIGLLVLKRFAGSESMHRPQLATQQIGLFALFFIGLICTAVASSWYHLQPNDAGLVVDRLGMTVAFAGLLGVAAAERVSLRAGQLLSVLILLLGSISVWFWSLSGNVLPWLVLQFGGMVVILWLASLNPLPGALAVRWGIVILLYTIAKVLELTDHAVYDLTGHLVSGHSLKHLVASFVAWPVIAALKTAVLTNRPEIASIAAVSSGVSPKARQNLKPLPNLF
jgi:hypothetical protein